MSLERVKKYFEEAGLTERIREFSTSSATVELAAAALGCEPRRIAKTLALAAGERVLLIVTAGDAKIDNVRYKAQFQAKAKMLSPEETLQRTGHAVGGVCPFAVHEGAEIYLDVSLKRFESVFPACGSANSAVELTISELERHSGFRCWVDVCKGWQA